jgi:hypothetical protein
MLVQGRFYGGLRLLAAAGIESRRNPKTQWLVYVGDGERTGIRELPGEAGVICYLPKGSQCAKLSFSPGLSKSGPLVVAQLSFFDALEGRVRRWTIPVPAQKAAGLASRV